jgi:hypothetical protein
MSEQEHRCCLGLSTLVQALQQQTAAINRMAASNEALVQAMAEAEPVDPDVWPVLGLDGRPAR